MSESKDLRAWGYKTQREFVTAALETMSDVERFEFEDGVKLRVWFTRPMKNGAHEIVYPVYDFDVLCSPKDLITDLAEIRNWLYSIEKQPNSEAK